MRGNRPRKSAKPPAHMRRPVPSLLSEWKREVEGIERFIRDAKAIPPGESDGWIGSMLIYYEKRLAYLKSHQPMEG